MFWIIVIAVLVIIFLVIKNSEPASENSNDNSEYNDALNEARKKKSFFENVATKQNGSVYVVANNIDNPDTIDWSREQYSQLIYFRVCLPNGYSPYTIEQLKNPSLSDDERKNVIDSYLLNYFYASQEEISALGIDPSYIVYDMVQGESAYEGILYYKFVCPCGLRGKERDNFINDLKK